MSMFNYVKEHLRVSHKKDPGEGHVTGGTEAVEQMRWNLAALSALMLTDSGELYMLRMTADGREYVYDRNEIMPEYRQIMDTMVKAREVDVEVYYGCWNCCGALELLNEHFEDIFDDSDDDPEDEKLDWDGVFYSRWDKYDGGEHPGDLRAYGIRDGKTYHGFVSSEAVAAVPDGEWSGIGNLSGFTGDLRKNPKPATPELLEACRVLAGFCDKEPELDPMKNEFYFYDFTIRSAEEGSRFMGALKTVRNMAEDFSILGGLVDVSSPDARVMAIDCSDEGDFTITIDQV